MKSIITVLTLFLLSCSMNQQEEISSRVLIRDSYRGVVTGLTSPTVDYVLQKDNEEDHRVSDFPLEDRGGYYSIDLTLLNQGTYRFSEFNIKDGGEVIYIVDKEHQLYIDGFTATGEVKIYLISVINPDFDDLDISQEDVSITFNESGSIGYVDLTFKVSSNVPDASFEVYMYSIYWKLGDTLLSNQIFDMDTGSRLNILDEGDGVPWGKGMFKIVTTNMAGDSVYLTGNSDDWNKKHIKLIF